MTISGFADGGDRSMYVCNPEGKVVEARDLLDRGESVRSVWGAAA